MHQAADGTLAIRNGNWKAVVGPEPMGTQLFDLDNDLGERHDVATANPDVVGELTTLLRKYIDNGRSTPGPACENDASVPLQMPLTKG